jgi:hypothetical protein
MSAYIKVGAGALLALALLAAPGRADVITPLPDEAGLTDGAPHAFLEAERRFAAFRAQRFISSKAAEVKRTLESLLRAMKELDATYLALEGLPLWGLASRVRRGDVQAELVAKMRAAPVPPGLDPESRRIFLEELVRLSSPILDDARQLWQTAIDRFHASAGAEASPAARRWVEHAQRALAASRAAPATSP